MLLLIWVAGGRYFSANELDMTLTVFDSYRKSFKSKPFVVWINVLKKHIKTM